MSEWTIQLLTSWLEIESEVFGLFWSDLARQASNTHVFFHPVLVRIWIETYRSIYNINPLFVKATRGKQQVLFPLVLWRRNFKNGFIRVVVPAGHSDFDYHDPLFLHPPTPEEINTFYTAMLKCIDRTVAYDRMIFDGLHEPYLPKFGTVTHSEGCLAWPTCKAECSDGIILPLQKSQARSTLRRYRRLQETGTVGFRRFTSTDDPGLFETLETMLEMHSKRWPNAYKAPGFHRKLIEQGLQAGIVDFVEMSLNGTPIAWQISFAYQGRFSLYMPAFDDTYIKYSLGHLSQGYAIGCAKQSGMSVVDHLRGAEEYKSAWGSEETRIYDVTFDRETVASRTRIAAYDLLRKISDINSGSAPMLFTDALKKNGTNNSRQGSQASS